jgi:tetratricopeptide (TPR) repeat protein
MLGLSLTRARKQRFRRAEAAALEGLGLVAKRRADWLAARAAFVQAEELLAAEPPEAKTSAVTQRAWTHFMTNELSHAIHVLETHLVELGEKGAPDPTALLQVYSYLIAPYFEAGFRERATEAAQRAHELEPKVHDPEHLACLNINRAQVLLEQGHRTDAMRALARAEDLYRQLGWRDSAAKAAIALATAALENGDLEAAELGARQALAELQESPSRLDEVRILNLLGRIARSRNEPRDALRYVARAGDLLADEGSLERAWNLREAALCYVDLEEPAIAEPLLRDALEMYRDAGAGVHLATTAAYLGDVLVRLGRAEEAMSVYREGLSEVEDLAV